MGDDLSRGSLAGATTSLAALRGICRRHDIERATLVDRRLGARARLQSDRAHDRTLSCRLRNRTIFHRVHAPAGCTARARDRIAVGGAGTFDDHAGRGPRAAALFVAQRYLKYQMKPVRSVPRASVWRLRLFATVLAVAGQFGLSGASLALARDESS